jgi:hypothetical protein
MKKTENQEIQQESRTKVPEHAPGLSVAVATTPRPMPPQSSTSTFLRKAGLHRFASSGLNSVHDAGRYEANFSAGSTQTGLDSPLVNRFSHTFIAVVVSECVLRSEATSAGVSPGVDRRELTSLMIRS